MSPKALEAVALAALAWNRARLVRIKVAKRVPVDYLHPAYTLAQRHLDAARKAEAKAKAALRSACAKADQIPDIPGICHSGTSTRVRAREAGHLRKPEFLLPIKRDRTGIHMR